MTVLSTSCLLPRPLSPTVVRLIVRVCVQPAMQPYMVLAERIGKMQAQISSSKVCDVYFPHGRAPYMR